MGQLIRVNRCSRFVQVFGLILLKHFGEDFRRNEIVTNQGFGETDEVVRQFVKLQTAQGTVVTFFGDQVWFDPENSFNDVMEALEPLSDVIGEQKVKELLVEAELFEPCILETKTKEW